MQTEGLKSREMLNPFDIVSRARFPHEYVTDWAVPSPRLLKFPFNVLSITAWEDLVSAGLI